MRYSNRWWRARKPSYDEGDIMFLPKLPYPNQPDPAAAGSVFGDAVCIHSGAAHHHVPRGSLLEHQVLHADSSLQVSSPHWGWLMPSFLLSASSPVLFISFLQDLLLIQERFLVCTHSCVFSHRICARERSTDMWIIGHLFYVDLWICVANYLCRVLLWWIILSFSF